MARNITSLAFLAFAIVMIAGLFSIVSDAARVTRQCAATGNPALCELTAQAYHDMPRALRAGGAK